MDLSELAIVKVAVPFGRAGDKKFAPKGQYEISECENGVAFCECDGTCDFTLSHDAFAQHVAEGRIALAG
ncbi:MAG: hypothetical protein AAGD92_09040 [Pseudomonadota bacterium]